jgi:hypothetical protein
MSSSAPSPVSGLRGRVSQGEFGKGSKSERQAVFIDTAEGQYVLRRKDGPAFGDDALKKYVGRTVACDGFLAGTTLLAERIEVVAD